MIKRIVLFLMIAAILYSCDQKPGYEPGPYTINVSIDTSISSEVFLAKRTESEYVHIDTTQLENGKCVFTGKIDFPERYYLQITEPKILVPFFAEATDIDIDIKYEDLNNSTIEGSLTNDEYEKYLDQLEALDDTLKKYMKEMGKAEDESNDERFEEVDKKIAEIYEEKDNFTYDYILKNNTLTSTPYIAFRNLYNWDLDQMKNIVDTLSDDLNKSVYKKNLDNRILILERLQAGKSYIPFSMPDTEGKYIDLADLINDNYLLIDFWASWCRPCRAENPNLVDCYKDYHDKGFEILGVSLDKDGGKWEKAIEEDNLTWYHVADLKGWYTDAAKLYGVISIPSNFLLDPQGNIVAKNLRGERLKKKLKEIFDK